MLLNLSIILPVHVPFQIRFQSQPSLFEGIGIVALLCPFAHVQRERFLTVSIFSKRDAVLFGKLIYIGQVKGLL